jgi:hypothetical protein
MTCLNKLLLLHLASKIFQIILIFKLLLRLLLSITHQEEAYKIKILVIKKVMLKIREFYNSQIIQIIQILQTHNHLLLLKGYNKYYLLKKEAYKTKILAIKKVMLTIREFYNSQIKHNQQITQIIQIHNHLLLLKGYNKSYLLKEGL